MIPNAKLVYNNSTVLQLDAELPPAGIRCLEQKKGKMYRVLIATTLMSVDYDDSELAAEADVRVSVPSRPTPRAKQVSSTT